MKKSFKIEGLCCATCADKMERGIERLEGVTNVRVNFLTQKFTLEADDENFDSILVSATNIIKDIEPKSALSARR